MSCLAADHAICEQHQGPTEEPTTRDTPSSGDKFHGPASINATNMLAAPILASTNDDGYGPGRLSEDSAHMSSSLHFAI